MNPKNLWPIIVLGTLCPLASRAAEQNETVPREYQGFAEVTKYRGVIDDPDGYVNLRKEPQPDAPVVTKVKSIEEAPVPLQETIGCSYSGATTLRRCRTGFGVVWARQCSVFSTIYDRLPPGMPNAYTRGSGHSDWLNALLVHHPMNWLKEEYAKEFSLAHDWAAFP